MSSPRGNGAATAHDNLDTHVRQSLAQLGRAGAQAAGAQEELPRDEVQRERLLRLFDAMAGSRLIDIQARRMRERGQGYYTIGSAGHESNAIVAQALRPTDPALLHYRSGGFFLARALQAGRTLDEALRGVLLGMFAAVADPASGGRHKVFGDASLAVIPQTSTIASHLPRAVGVAFAIGRARRLRVPTRWQPDSVAICSFGDASLNHSTAAGALNTAGYCVQQGLPLPLLFVCEDNGLGISVPSPSGWVAQAAHRPGIRYFAAQGEDPEAVREAAEQAVTFARRERRPALLHLRTVRYLGHAGSDVESGYRSPAAIAADLERDPLLAVAALIRPAAQGGVDRATEADGVERATQADGVDLAQRYDAIARQVRDIGEELADVTRLSSAAEVIAPLAPRTSAAARVEAAGAASALVREQVVDGGLPGRSGALTLAQVINATLSDALAGRPELVVFGEDVGRKGGVYGLTRGLQQRFGAARVFDTLLDEQSILGLGLGLGVSGLLPVPEIQYLAYLHNAEDQLRGEAASLRFFSNGAYTNPMVVRIAGLAYQKGFGGHFHNDDAVGVLRDIPGLVVALPAHPSDAGPLLRACLTAAADWGQVSAFLEPIALYHERDLHEAGDRGWLGRYLPDEQAEIGTGRTHGDGSDLTIVTFGNGVRMSLRVARRLGAAGIAARVLDLRWLSPLPVEDLLREANATGRVLIADETRHSGGVGEGVLAALVENGYTGRMARVASRDSFIPLGEAANLVLLSEADIEHAAHALLRP